jgi:hypothetical protein
MKARREVTTRLTAHERERLLQAVDRWVDLGGAWYVDTHLAPVVEAILADRLRSVRNATDSR